MNKTKLKEQAQKALTRIAQIDGQDMMAFGMSIKGLYYDYFGSTFPSGSCKQGAGIEMMLQAIIDDKPYVPAVA